MDGACAELLDMGSPGPLTVGLLLRLGGPVVRTSSFPPSEDHVVITRTCRPRSVGTVTWVPRWFDHLVVVHLPPVKDDCGGRVQSEGCGR